MRKFAILTLGIIIITSLFAPFFAPYSYKTQFRNFSGAPPMKLHFFDVHDGKRIFVPHFHPLIKSPEGFQEKNDICNIHFFRRGKFFSCSCECFILGTDSLGRDIFSRLLYGGRISLGVAILGVTVTAFLGLFFGGLAGYFGGLTDMIIMRTTEVLMSLPSFFLLLALSVVIPPGISSAETFLLIVLILSFIGWASFARVIRGMTASISASDHVLASKSMGAGHLRTLFFHVLPLTFGYTIVVMTLNIPAYIIGESALSMLGLGIREPDPSWGNMLAAALNISLLAERPWILTPGLFIVLSVTSFNVLGEWLREKVVVKEEKKNVQ